MTPTPNSHSVYGAPLGSAANPFGSLEQAQRYGFSYMGHYDDELDYVRLTILRGELHFKVGFARRPSQEAR